MGLLEHLLLNADGKPHKQVIALFSINNGVSQRKALEYYNQLIDSGKVKAEVKQNDAQ